MTDLQASMDALAQSGMWTPAIAVTGLSAEQVSSIRKKCDEDAFIAATLIGKPTT